jgi:predicted RNA-binding protein YlxR (DUF448 family)
VLVPGSPPMRTCVGCREVAPRGRLVRVVRESDSSNSSDRAPRLKFDPNGSAPGRGAWIHPWRACLDLALARGGFARSFRGAVDPGPLGPQFQAVVPHMPAFPREQVEATMDIR